MEKADVFKSNVKTAERKAAVFILALDCPTISLRAPETIVRYQHNAYEKQMTALPSKFAAYIQGLCREMTVLFLSIKLTSSM